MVFVALVLGHVPWASAQESRLWVRLPTLSAASTAAKNGDRWQVRPLVRPDQLSKVRLDRGKQLPALSMASRWVELRVPGDAKSSSDLAKWLSSLGAELIEPAYSHQTASIPNDVQLSNQRYLELVGAYDAFDIIRGEEGEVVVAVVDGGTDWRHEDLQANVVTRSGEVEGNGIDDDGNGFVDDVRGWNFANDSPDPAGLSETPGNADHGTHVAGIIGAVTDNALGIAGLAFNARVLPVNVSTDDPERDGQLDHAMRGLLYAAMTGAPIINASWGRGGRWSDFEADVVAAVHELGALIVGAAGNIGPGLSELEPFYPAFYPEVLSVTQVGPDLRRPISANRDYWIDVAAPGSIIWSTLDGNRYGSQSGTSQAAAVVSSAAALILTQRPDLAATQLRQQIRWTTRSIEDFNPGWSETVGTGLLDIPAALTTDPAGIRIAKLTVVDDDGDGIVGVDEQISFQVDVRGELSDRGPVTLELVVDDPSLIPLSTTYRLGRVIPGQPIEVRDALSAFVPFGAEIGRLVPMIIRIEAGGRTVHQGFYPEILPLHATLSASRLQYSVTANGRLGYSSVTRKRDPGGVGLRRPGSPSVVLGGSFLVGTGPTRVSDAVISARPPLFEDFGPVQGGALVAIEVVDGRREVVSVFSDRFGSAPLSIRVEQRGITFDDDREGDFALVEYKLRATANTVQNARVGWLVDWEFPSPGQEEANQIGFDAQHDLLYAHGRDGDWAGLAIVAGGSGSVDWNWLYDFAQTGTDRPGIFDLDDVLRKLPDESIWELMTTSGGPGLSPETGVAGVLTTGPWTLVEEQDATVVVAFVMGRDQQELANAAQRARIAYEARREGVSGLPARPSLLTNLPNPFNPRTELRFTLPNTQDARVLLYDARGRRVRILHEGTLAAGFHRVPWDGVDENGRPAASGVYRVLLQTPSGTASQPIVLIR